MTTDNVGYGRYVYCLSALFFAPTDVHHEDEKLLTDRFQYCSHVKAGKKIQFKGTDLLTVDLGSRKIKEVYTSADLLNYYRALDYDLGVWSA